jgi:hypothetical protein
MNRICSDPEYRDILTLILIKIKDVETYQLFLSICNNMKRMLLDCKDSFYFSVSRFVCCIIEVTRNRVNKRVVYTDPEVRRNYSIESIKIYKEPICNFYIYTGYEFDGNLNICTHKDGDTSHTIDFDAWEIIGIRIELESAGHIKRLCNIYLFDQSGKRVADIDGNHYIRSVSLPFSTQIPIDFIRNGSTYFETEQGIDHLNQIKQFTNPYITQFRNESNL